MMTSKQYGVLELMLSVSGIDYFPSVRMDNLSSDVRRFVASQEHIGMSDLHWLACSAKGCVCSECRYFFGLERGGYKWCPDRARGYTINANSFLREIRR